MTFVAGDRVRLRRDSDLRELFAGLATEGIVMGCGADADGIERVMIQLDDGKFAVGVAAADWDVGSEKAQAA